MKALQDNSSLNRRRFIFAGTTSVISAALWSLARAGGFGSLACLPKYISIPAESMKGRADAVRKDFVEKHLIQKQPYPLPKAFHSSSMLPKDEAIGKKLLTKGDGYLRLNAQGVFINGKSGDSPIVAPFGAILCDKIFGLSVSFPGLIRITPKYDDSSLTLDFGTNDPLDNPLFFKLIDNLPDCNTPIIIGLQQIIRRLTVTDKEIRLETVDRSQTDCRFTLTLKLVPDNKVDRIQSALMSLRTRIKSFASVLTILAMSLFLAGCCPPFCGKPSNTNNPKCPIGTHKDCCGLQFDGYINMGGDSYSNACHQGPYNNSCSYENVTNKEKDCVLKPCALIGSQPNRVPTEYGWKLVGYETDLYRCGGDIYKDNIMVIKRTKIIGQKVK